MADSIILPLVSCLCLQDSTYFENMIEIPKNIAQNALFKI